MRPVKVASARSSRRSSGGAGEIGNGARDVEQAEPSIAVGRDEQSVGVGDVAFGHVEHDGGDPARLGDHGARGLDHQCAREAHGAVGMGAAARRQNRAVAAQEIDRLRRHPEAVGHHLPEAGLVALPARLRADEQIDAVGLDLHRHALVRHADRGLEIVDDADAEQPAAPLRLPAAGGKAVPVRGFDARARGCRRNPRCRR